MNEWRDTFQRNWVYMVAATLLSVLLWVAVNADTVKKEVVPADLVVVNGDRRFVLTARDPETSTVDVLFSGRTGDIVPLLSLARPRVVVTIDSVESRTVKVPLRADMVRARDGDDLTDVRALSVVQPDTLSLHFEPRLQKVVRVVPRLRLSTADGFMVADSVRVRPGAVDVEGPESVVAQIDSLLTPSVMREKLRASLRLEVPLERPDATGLELSRSTIEVIIPVDERVERIITDVRVIVEGGRGMMGADPAAVALRVVGPRRFVEEATPELFHAVVRVDDGARPGDRVPIAVRNAPPFTQVSIEPDSVKLVASRSTV